MTQTRISAALRREVRERAEKRCEYCLLAESQAFFPHEPDHLIALQHGGKTVSANLALACFNCNRFKGSNIASLDPITGELVALFNPRTQKWSKHFRLNSGRIIPLTPVGRATEKLLRLNLPSRVEARERWAALGLYP
ncbi:MAG TPA: HNH endonuclease signature motif containing protein [Pyrinomonadaceae bacterium]|nr:HNH endonuclease signature motif containing protein [Pyrinomonadaceae bacterium]